MRSLDQVVAIQPNPDDVKDRKKLLIEAHKALKRALAAGALQSSQDRASDRGAARE